MNRRVLIKVTLVEVTQNDDSEILVEAERHDDHGWTFDGKLYPAFLHVIDAVEQTVREFEKITR